jgi:thymidylate synthase (FAD)
MLTDSMPRPELSNPDLSIVQAARVSFLGESKGEEADRKLLKYLWKHRHTSPFEMVQLKMVWYAPLVVWWQLVRHRTGSYNFQSGRYTEFEENAFYKPEQWRLQSKSNKQGSDGVADEAVSEAMNYNLTYLYGMAYEMYRNALEAGIAKEQARLFLPGFSVYYKAVVNFDLNNLLHMLRLRTAPEAQWEIRQYAETVLRNFVAPLVPWTYEEFTNGQNE